ncbi:hypothetical protein TH2_181 [Shewanella phage Thanatos-2]|nr:hypothetical protein TH2_181 [Shewanella phage Thanatos-2]
MTMILPENTELPDVQEYTQISQVFSVELTTGQELKSIELIPSELNSGLSYTDSSYSGKYENVFTGGVLKYWDNQQEISTTWTDLPPGKDLFLWQAPKVLTKTYYYTVRAVIIELLEEKIIEKTYSQIVFGNWSVWANQLREYF